MGKALFFHLTHTSADEIVRAHSERALSMGWRVAIRGRDSAALARLDEWLWAEPREGFLPHGLSGGPHDADQPLLLTQGMDLPNRARALIALDGAAVTADEVRDLERVWIVFDGNDADCLSIARGQWTELAQGGFELEYWGNDGSGWVRRQARPAAGSAAGS